MPSSKRSRVPVTVAKWSADSQRLASYCLPPSYYTDIEYRCYHCSRPSVFTAEQQRQAFEVRQAYIWQRRMLCEQCFIERLAHQRAVKAFQSRWRSARAELAKEPKELQAWLSALEALPRYGAKRNTAHIAMLTRMLSGMD